MIIYFWGEDKLQKKIARNLQLSKETVGRVVRMLKQVCGADLARRPIIPFGGPAFIVKCDESKFNHKAKVNKIERVKTTFSFKNMIYRERLFPICRELLKLNLEFLFTVC